MFEFSMLGFFTTWILFGIATAMVAANKGRNPGGWFLVGALFGPFGLIIALVAKKDTAALERDALASGEMRKCPSCAELVRAEAARCRFCQHELPPINSDPPSLPLGDAALARLEEERQAQIGQEKRERAERLLNARRQAIEDALNDPKLLNVFGPEGKTPLMLAVGFRDTEAIRALLAAGARTNQLWTDPDTGRYVSIEAMAKECGIEWSALVAKRVA